MEIWKAIEGTDGKYEVSNTGKVRSLDYKRTGRTQELSTRRNNSGYLIVSLSAGGKPITRLLHRLVATAFLPNPSSLPQVNHKDGNKENCRAENLEWCDGAYNMKHASENGLLENVKKAAKEGIHRLDAHREAQKIKVVSINMKTGEYGHHESMLGAVKSLGIPSTKEIITILSNGCGTSKGYTFVLAADFNPENIPDIIQKTTDFKTASRRRTGMQNAKKIIATKCSDATEKEYECIADAARELGVFASNISAVLNGDAKTAKGYTFKLAEEVVK